MTDKESAKQVSSRQKRGRTKKRVARKQRETDDAESCPKSSDDRAWCGCLPLEKRRVTKESDDAIPHTEDGTIAATSDKQKTDAPEDMDWWAVMFAKKGVSDCTAIQATSHVEDLLGAIDGTSKKPPRKKRAETGDGEWNPVVVIGPNTKERVTEMCALWSKQDSDGEQTTIGKVARGEAIATIMSTPGYVNWREVFDIP